MIKHLKCVFKNPVFQSGIFVEINLLLKKGYRYKALGDSAISLDFGNVLDEETNRRVIALAGYLQKQNIAGVRDIIPCYASLTIVYDPVVAAEQHPSTGPILFYKKKLQQALRKNEMGVEESNLTVIPVCYDETLAPDLNAVAKMKKISVEKVMQLHTEIIYRVYMIGFLPGFAYMGKTDPKLMVPRKESPEKLVASGSVAIAGFQTGIYPLDSPGGWQIIGRTPQKMFDPQKTEPVLLHPGERVQFKSITLNEYRRIFNSTNQVAS